MLGGYAGQDGGPAGGGSRVGASCYFRDLFCWGWREAKVWHIFFVQPLKDKVKILDPYKGAFFNADSWRKAGSEVDVRKIFDTIIGGHDQVE